MLALLRRDCEFMIREPSDIPIAYRKYCILPYDIPDIQPRSQVPRIAGMVSTFG